jgi:hypothetical protein
VRLPRPVHPEPGEPVDASGVTRPCPAGRPRRLESPQELNVHTVTPYWIDVAIGGLLVLGLCVSRSMESIANARSRRPAG